MKEILSSWQMKQADEYMVTRYHFPNYLLMEQAALGIFHWLKLRYTPEERFLIVYGNGNNGGDGLALARLLAENGYTIGILPATDWSKDHPSIQLQLSLLEDLPITYVTDFNQFKSTIIIDAIFGIGLSRPLSKDYIQRINQMNTLGLPIISIDIPSGLYEGCQEADVSIVATYTLMIGFYKRLAFLESAIEYCGKLELIPMGINSHRMPKFDTPPVYLLDHSILSSFPKRNKLGHKGSFGTSLLVGGSNRMPGSIILASMASACIGSGVVEVMTETQSQLGLLTHLPEAIVHSCCFEDFLDIEQRLNRKINAICIGPGLGRNHYDVLKIVLDYSHHHKIPTILDADALYLLSQHQELIHTLHEGCILTPHLKEMSRLSHCSIEDIRHHPIQVGESFLEKFKGVLVLKSTNTYIFTQNASYIYQGQCPILGTAGSGDILSGLICGLLSQGLNPSKSARLGVYLHGEGGKTLAQTNGNNPILAREIINGVYDFIKEYNQL